MTKKLLSIFIILFGFLSMNQAAESIEDARMLINLMDYIAKDYVMAVKGGQVVNEFEYAEMGEFSATASEFALKLAIDVNDEPSIPVQVEELKQLISDTANYETVSAKARSIKNQLLAMNLVSSYPSKLPDLASGAEIFKAQCASCHGATGAGDGLAGAGLTPSPTNFTNKEIMSGVAPFQSFNTIRLGIPGTGMRAFNELSDDQVWNLAFYIASIQHLDKSSSKPKLNLSLEDLATLSDNELRSKFDGIDLAGHRSNPVAPSNDTKLGPIELTRTLLSKSQKSYADGDFAQATQYALDAYLKGVEPIEPQIMASDNKLFMELESNMMGIRAKIKGEATTEEFDMAIAAANISLDKAEEIVSQKSRSLGMTTFIASSILIREGLEAFFVILAILGMLRSVNAPHAIRWVHGGWLAAVGAGIIGWFFADSLMDWSAASRELMEGLIALFAVIVLLYLGYWMHGKTEAAKWKEFVETKIKALVNKNSMIGLGAFSFVVVFRESFESVLFLSSLTADGEASSKTGVFLGFVLSAGTILFIAWAILKWFKKLPISKVFLYSSMVILALAFVLAGQGVHAIQEGGFISINSFPINLRFGTLGIYPTYESILTQAGILGLIALLWKFSSSQMTKKPA
jgi:high-affinity iron transporter